MACWTDTLTPDVTDGGSSGDAVVLQTIKQGFFLLLFCYVLGIYVIFVLTLHHCNKIPSLRKSQHKTITITICIAEYRENNSRFCRYAGNKTNSAAKLGI